MEPRRLLTTGKLVLAAAFVVLIVACAASLGWCVFQFMGFYLIALGLFASGVVVGWSWIRLPGLRREPAFPRLMFALLLESITLAAGVPMFRWALALPTLQRAHPIFGFSLLFIALNAIAIIITRQEASRRPVFLIGGSLLVCLWVYFFYFVTADLVEDGLRRLTMWSRLASGLLNEQSGAPS